MIKTSLGLLCGLYVALASGQASADALSDFYKDKTLTIIIRGSPGGGYDTDARVMAPGDRSRDGHCRHDRRPPCRSLEPRGGTTHAPPSSAPAGPGLSPSCSVRE